MRGKVTVQEIADLAGVSKFAVSRTLNGKPGVSIETREMILRVAGQLGYYKNGPTSKESWDGDIQNSSGTILVLFPNVRYQNRESTYWGPIFNGVSERLNQKGMNILTLTELSSEHMFSLINPKGIHGIITIGYISTGILLDIHRFKIPIVMVDHQDPAIKCDTVFADNFNCMRELTTKLVSKGYSNLQFVGDIGDAQSFLERWLAFRSTLEQLGIEHLQLPRLTMALSDEAHAILEIADEDIPDVFVCANDRVALFMIENLERRGIHVPSQCAVTGFDNADKDMPIYATVDINKELLGIRAVDQMLWRIDNPTSDAERKLIQGDILFREQFATGR